MTEQTVVPTEPADNTEATPTSAAEATTQPTEPAGQTQPAADATATQPTDVQFGGKTLSEYSAEEQKFITDKGLTGKGVSDLISIYKNAEKKLGASIPLLADDADDEAVEAFYKRMGVPDNPDGYGFNAKSPAEKDLLSLAHQCKMDKRVAARFVNAIVQMQAAEEQNDTNAYNEEYSTLKASWGDAAKSNEDIVNRGLGIHEVTQDELRGIAGILGVERAVAIFQTLGGLKSDATGIGGSVGSGGEETLTSYIERQRNA